MTVETVSPAPILNFTDAAAIKVKGLIEEEKNDNLKLRVFVSGGGCSGFQYGFTFDEVINDGDTTIEKNGVKLLVDPMSFQYLVGADSQTAPPSLADKRSQALQPSLSLTRLMFPVYFPGSDIHPQSNHKVAFLCNQND